MRWGAPQLANSGSDGVDLAAWLCTVPGIPADWPQRTVAALYVETGGLAHRLARRLRIADSGCLIWTGYCNAKGYGSIAVKTSKPGYTHRVAWELAHGPIPDGLCVLHKCDTPACCNTAHLFLGTKADNNADMRAKGRDHPGSTQAAQTHCKRGHPFDSSNTRFRAGKRVCRMCAKDWMRQARSDGRHA